MPRLAMPAPSYAAGHSAAADNAADDEDMAVLTRIGHVGSPAAELRKIAIAHGSSRSPGAQGNRRGTVRKRDWPAQIGPDPLPVLPADVRPLTRAHLTEAWDVLVIGQPLRQGRLRPGCAPARSRHRPIPGSPTRRRIPGRDPLRPCCARSSEMPTDGW